jgi:small subunit ribosomal protein S9
MQDETRDNDVTPDQTAPGEETPDESAPGEDVAAPAGGDAPAPADEPDAPVGDEPASPAEEPAPADEAPAEEPAPADEAPAEEPTPQPEAPREEPKAKERKTEEAPGADLEPIRLEEERELSAEERARLEAEREEQARLEAEAVEEGTEEPLREGAKLELPADTRIQATGKRKTSVARVVIAQGGGEFKVNRRPLDEYFPRSYHQTIARQALTASGYDGQVDVSVRVHGGGISGQADAVRHGIARALVEIDPELRGELKRRGMLTRDARAKERRKAGLKKARKRPQFSKR